MIQASDIKWNSLIEGVSRSSRREPLFSNYWWRKLRRHGLWGICSEDGEKENSDSKALLSFMFAIDNRVTVKSRCQLRSSTGEWEHIRCGVISISASQIILGRSWIYDNAAHIICNEILTLLFIEAVTLLHIWSKRRFLDSNIMQLQRGLIQQSWILLGRAKSMHQRSRSSWRGWKDFKRHSNQHRFEKVSSFLYLVY